MTAPRTTPYGFGIVGVGMIADFHAQAIARTSGGSLRAIATRNVDNAQAFGRKHQVPFVTTDVTALVNRPDVDVVCVTTPSGAHLEPALAAIRAGKHVVIEKPIEITPQRADELLDAADRAGVRVVPIFQARFGDGARRLKKAVEAGRFGRLVLASAYVKWHRSKEYYTGWKGTAQLDGGGALMNQAIHAVDQLQWFAGMPAEVFGYTTRVVHTGIQSEDTAVAVLKYPGGARGTIEASTGIWPGWSRRIELCGENGSVAMEDDRLTHWEFRDSQPGDEAIRAAGQTNDLGSGASNPSAITVEGHQRQIQDLIDALHAGRAPALNGREGRKAVALIRAIYDSAESGRPVVVT